MVAILNFRIFHKNCKTQKCLYLENPNLENFLNTLALTVISFSGRFVFAQQKHVSFLQAIH